MVRSFFDVATTVIHQQSPDDRSTAETLAHAWAQWAEATFLRAYLDVACTADSGLAPSVEEDLELLIDIFLLERVFYEVAYDLDNRPDRAAISLHNARRMLRTDENRARSHGV